ncbi:MAG TPA: YsnF/AvaK domain-containing protein [Noviherbaspirillum sp.]|uniref:YsnF/AvaK domain-containing protein n=1 Tax=Noviherbaspirillum sp. TaxID=1926288 RepID=UPI002B4A6192|nr:YsnF/AvaK domain-containing protein [Noviherbaspirillum sp.]HJV86492.1 YsnF/AvaK domain-containing protein [Noviherbaspirillum sp.]
MENTVVGVYDSYAQAQNAMNELLASGFSRDEVQLSPESETEATTTKTGGSAIGNFFRSLFGMDEHREEHDVYSEAVRRGSCVLTVDADSDEERDRAADIMNRYDPVDIDERAAHWRTQGWAGYDENAPRYTQSEIDTERQRYATDRATTAAEPVQQQTRQAREGETRIPVVEEELRVGKRAVQRGGVRVYTRVEEKPVHETVELRQEHVNVERHPVDQPASEADLAAFKEGSVELRETAEEPVVSKTARVVEEVVVGKEVTQETQDVNDTVRKTDVEVEQLGASNVGRAADMATDDTDFRRHWQNAYGPTGGRYEDYDAAYRYGSNMAGTERFRNYRWEDVEPDIRSDWERQHPESAWDKVKDAVRYGAERRHH